MAHSSPDATTRPGSQWYRVPVEHRILGLDKRSFPFALIVLALWLGLQFGVPAVNDAVANDDLTVAGDRMLVTETLAITPTTGWEVNQGIRTTDDVSSPEPEAVYLTKGGVQFFVQSDDFEGDATELLDQIDRVAKATDPSAFNPATHRSTVTTTAGITGVAETVQGAATTGQVIALTEDGTGIEIQVAGPSDQMATLAPEVHRMIQSLGPVKSTEEN
ncbi:hypothetical protein [Aeromicrobium choanae]|uniref:Uncharacterized protein n=1 Tax=Aeromicrobium choanae TaxID=1736691 RepID=A0A1T4Z6D9_9ACTN|nr:hypothetical protein [Aeromicrobium choanae]SKB09516.1 hypothetical protein SAMN06295964_2732 [Aeromicrobium choanae]